MTISIFITICSIVLIGLGMYHLSILIPYVRQFWNGEHNGVVEILAFIGMLCSDIQIAWGICLFVKYIIL